MTEAKELFEKVIKNDYCIGCGACASVKNSPFEIKFDIYGNIVAFPKGDLENNNEKFLEICPFSDKSKNENEISEIFYDNVKNKDHRIGNYLKCYAGYVKEGIFREIGSSGGVGKWLGYTLLSENKIDYFVHVVPNQTNDPNRPLFDYEVVTEKDDILKGSKSSYYPVSLVEVIKLLKEKEGRFAITGVPCFIKTLRLLSLKDENIRSKIKFTIGIVCGGMKSANQSKMIGWQLGVKPENLVSIDFRRKHVDKPASHKIYQVWSNTDKKEYFKDSYEIYGTDWGASYFKPNACDYCDDVVGETSDISIGDAWLPKYVNDSKGTNIIIVRNPEILELLEKHNEKGVLYLDEVTAEEVAISQSGGLRHRREALSYRIEKKEAQNKWFPPKRVQAKDFEINNQRKNIYSLRETIAKQSHISFLNSLKNNDFNIFVNEMAPLEKKYYNAKNGGLLKRGIKKAKRVLKKVLQIK
jgi:coenzyme F420-reducing hydrogenase beta subunit